MCLRVLILVSLFGIGLITLVVGPASAVLMLPRQTVSCPQSQSALEQVKELPTPTRRKETLDIVFYAKNPKSLTS